MPNSKMGNSKVGNSKVGNSKVGNFKGGRPLGRALGHKRAPHASRGRLAYIPPGTDTSGFTRLHAGVWQGAVLHTARVGEVARMEAVAPKAPGRP